MAIHNSINICNKCGAILNDRVDDPRGVVIVVKVVCKKCKINYEKKAISIHHEIHDRVLEYSKQNEFD